MYDDTIPAIWNLFPRPPHWVMNNGLADKVATVRVDAATFGDLGRMREITAETLGRLGCGECHSGWDIRFLLDRVQDFRVNPKGELQELPGLGFGFGR